MSTLFDLTFNHSIPVIRPHDTSFLKQQAQEFDEIVEQLRAKKYTSLVLDLSLCEYISSDGLGVVAKCWHWCHEEGHGSMALALADTPDNEVNNLFDITGLSRTIGSALQRNVADAVNYLQQFS
jgi:anti-anti-sigma factor